MLTKAQVCNEIADILEVSYVDRFPDTYNGEHCALTALDHVTNPFLGNQSGVDVHQAIWADLERISEEAGYNGGISSWSDNSGKEVVVTTFRELAKNAASHRN